MIDIAAECAIVDHMAMFMVTADNAHQFPLEVGTVVKWVEWRRSQLPSGEVEWELTIRATERPIPEELRALFATKDWSTEERTPFVAWIDPPTQDGEEGPMVTIPFRTYRLLIPPLQPTLEGAPTGGLSQY